MGGIYYFCQSGIVFQLHQVSWALKANDIKRNMGRVKKMFRA
jgi:hypothetical protein